MSGNSLELEKRLWGLIPVPTDMRLTRWGDRAPEGGVCETTPEQHARLDELERLLTNIAAANGQKANEPLGLNSACADHEHLFFPGMYVRVMHMRPGSVATSVIHAREHPFSILQGEFVVWDGGEGSRIIRAPYIGRTLPGTRRAVIALTPVAWATYHVNPSDTRDFEQIFKEHTILHTNPLLGDGWAGASDETLPGTNEEHSL